jgi:hypothetical protein
MVEIDGILEENAFLELHMLMGLGNAVLAGVGVIVLNGVSRQ